MSVTLLTSNGIKICLFSRYNNISTTNCESLGWNHLIGKSAKYAYLPTIYSSARMTYYSSGPLLCHETTGEAPQTSLFINLHWLPIAVRIKFKALMFANKTTSGSAPLYLNSVLQTYVPSRSVCSAIERHINVPSQRGTKSLSQTFSLNVPSWWNDLHNSIRAAESLPIFKKRLKTHLFHLYLTL